jgi:hypothetical protein
MAENIDWQAQLPPGREILILDPVLERLQPTLDAMVNEQGLTPRQVVEGLTLTQSRPPAMFPVITDSMVNTLYVAIGIVNSGSEDESAYKVVQMRGPAITALLELTKDFDGMKPGGDFGGVLEEWGWRTSNDSRVVEHRQSMQELRRVVPKALQLIEKR